MTELMTAVTAGAGAGLGVAVPLGAIGVLLVQEGMRDRRAAVAAALAVAVVDLLYAAVAVVLGPLVAAAAGVEAWVRLTAAVVLLVIVGRGLRTSFAPVPPAGVVPAGPGAGPAAGRGAASRTFVRFAALTLVNPATALYFTALTTARGTTLAGPGAAAFFLGGVFAASLVWQQLLVAAAARAGGRFPPAVRAWTFRCGYGLVAVYAVGIALPLP